MCIVKCLLLLIAALPILSAGRKIDQALNDIVIPDELVVRLKSGVTLTALLAAANSTATRVPIDLHNNTHVVKVPLDQRENLIQFMAASPLVEYVEPHRRRAMASTGPSDPSFATQWYLSKLQAANAWTLFPGNLSNFAAPGKRIRIAILDTGFDCNHPDFINMGGTSPDSAFGGQLSFALSRALVPTTAANSACPWQDDNGHGTHLAGLVAAATHNATGIAALGFPLELISYKVLDSTGSGPDAAIAAAITQAADAGARVILLSFGGPGYSQLLQEAIDYAWRSNALLVAAAGNGNTTSPYFPARSNFVLSVGATDSTDARASFSNYGGSLGVVAPGLSLYSTYAPARYTSLNGTSMSAALVAAVAGMLAGASPDLPPDVLAQRVEMAAESATAGGGWAAASGYGRINAWRALSGAFRPATLGGLVGRVVASGGGDAPATTLTIGTASVTTTSNGLFRLTNLPAGLQTLTVTAPGLSPKSIYTTIPAGADGFLQISLGQPAGTFSGEVTSLGTPLARAAVTALQNGTTIATAVTDSLGRYSLPVPAGVYQLRAAAFGYAAMRLEGLSIADSMATSVSFSLNRFAVIQGVVRDTAQTPLAGVQISVSNSEHSAGGVTGANGEYTTLGLPAGTYTLTAALDQYTTAPVTGLAVIDGGSSTVNLEMTRVGSLAGLTISAGIVGGGSTVPSNIVTIATPAPAGGAVVFLSSSAPSLVALPPTVTIPAGSTASAPFSITTSAVTAKQTVTISARLAGTEKVGKLILAPYALSTLTLTSASVGGGSSTSTNRVGLNYAAPAAGARILLSSSDPSIATTPESVTAVAGSWSSPSFPITTARVAAPVPVVITATYGASSVKSNMTVMPTALSAFQLASTAVVGGKPASVVATLNSPAPPEGAQVMLTSSDPAAMPPSVILVKGGALASASIAIPTSGVTTSTQVNLIAVYGGVTRTAVLTVNPPALSALTMPGTSFIGGKTITGATVSLTGPAPPSGAVVTLTSSHPAATLPASISIPAGATISSAFSIATTFVPSQADVTITASFAGTSKASTFALKPPALSAFTVSPISITGGRPFTSAVVTLDGPAPVGDAVVSLTSSVPSLTPPSSVRVTAGTTASAPFPIPTLPVLVSTSGTLTASYGAVSRTVTLTLNPLGLSSLTAPASAIFGGQTLSGLTVTLDGPAPPPDGAVVSLSSSHAAATVPASVTVPPGVLVSPAFSVAASLVDNDTPAVITATINGASRSFAINIKPVALSSLTLLPSAVTGGKPLAGTLTLNAPAPPSAVVLLTSSQPAVVPVSSVTVPAGATSASFTVASGSVAVATTATVSASFGSVTRQASVNLLPPSLVSLSASTVTRLGGVPFSGVVVQLDGPAPPEGVIVTLSSSNPACLPPQSVLIPAGQTVSPAFSIDTIPVDSPTAVTITASFGGVSRSLNLTVAAYASAACLSAASGNWNSPATWTSCNGRFPSVGDTYTIAAGHTVTIPSGVTIIVGSSPAGCTLGVACPLIGVHNGSLINEGTLVLRGSVTQGNSTVTLRAGSVTRFDASQAASPAGQTYAWIFTGGLSKGNRAVLMEGTPYSYVTVESDAGGGNGYFWTPSGYSDQFNLTAAYTDFIRIGDSTNPSLQFRPAASPTIQTLANCRFDGGGGVSWATPAPVAGGWSIIGSTWDHTQNSAIGSLRTSASSAQATGTRVISGNVFDRLVTLSPNSATIDNNLFYRTFMSSTGAWSNSSIWNSFSGNLVRIDSKLGDGYWAAGEVNNNYFLLDGPPEPLFTGTIATVVAPNGAKTFTITVAGNPWTARQFSTTNSQSFDFHVESGPAAGEVHNIMLNDTNSLTLLYPPRGGNLAGATFSIYNTPENLHWGMQAPGLLTSVYRNNIFDSNGTSNNGDIMYLKPAGTAGCTSGTPATLTMIGNISLPSASLDNPGTITHLGQCTSPGYTYEGHHNTLFSGAQAGLAVAEQYAGHTGTITSWRSNITWAVANIPYAATGQQGNNPARSTIGPYIMTNNVGKTPATGLVALAGHNAKWNLMEGRLSTPGGGYDITNPGDGSFGLGDVSADPQFKDWTVNLYRWGQSLGLTGSRMSVVDQTLSRMRKRNDPDFDPRFTIAALQAFIRDGMTPTNPAYRSAAHDGTDIGAVPMPTPSNGGPITASSQH